MGVVRREGDWRLEKQEEGLYEITYQQEPQTIAVTPDYSPGMVDDLAVSTVPVHEVNSYTEAEGLFEEHAHGGQPAGMGLLGGGGRASSPSSPIDADSAAPDLSFDHGEGDGDSLEDSLPPGGLAVAFIFAGGLFLSQSGFSPGEPMFLLGAGIGGIGVAVLAWAGIIFRTQGGAAALDFLVTVDDEETSGSSTSNTSDEPETTPPTPESLKNELIFERADQYCEWCTDGPLDNPEVHHIIPRNEGGPNDPDNLIVLCPTCHRKADNGGISRTKLRGKMKHILGQEA